MSKFVGAPSVETTCLFISGIFIHLRRSASDSGHYLSSLRVCEVFDERLSVVVAIFGKRGAPAPVAGRSAPIPGHQQSDGILCSSSDRPRRKDDKPGMPDNTCPFCFLRM